MLDTWYRAKNRFLFVVFSCSSYDYDDGDGEQEHSYKKYNK